MRPVDVAKSQPVTVQVPLHIVIVRVFALLEKTVDVLILKLFALKVHLVTVIAIEVFVLFVFKFPDSVTVPPNASIIIPRESVIDLVSSVYDHLPEKVYSADHPPDTVSQDISVSDQKSLVGDKEGVQVNAVVQVAPVQSILFPSLGISAVTVCEVQNALAIDTSS